MTIATPHQTVRTNLETRAATWTSTPIYFKNVVADENGYYIKFFILFSDNRYTSLGGGTARVDGVINALVIGPDGVGTGQLISYAESFGALFAKQNIGGTLCQAPSLRDTDESFSIAVVVPFRHDH